VFWKSAISAFAEKPVLGWGIGGWNIYKSGQDEPNYPHNLFLQVAAEEGLLGLTALLMFLGIVFLRAKEVFEETRGYFAFVILVLVLTLGETMFSGDLDSARQLWMWCGTTLAVCRMVRQGRLSPADLESTASESPLPRRSRQSPGFRAVYG
jgi:O-antigen ligase